MKRPYIATFMAFSLMSGAGQAMGETSPEAVAVEEAVLGSSIVRLHLHPFLMPEEVSVLRLVLTNEQALAIFVPDAAGSEGRHAALAAAPGEGVVREGKPVASAIALAGFADAAAADQAARAACDAARGEGAACVTVLEVAPAP